ncbi:hypothetical protein PCANC_21011 [Puccinia coronata f. sp. avenae]|uniref:Uncharacterized protein n=1 Tax=Puccinia coronata f. sp. avenae TaxID=200324 RepID=A0A2N5U232_9BASI|nr:hypothetical protein PCANC_21011 [Puccinia coronata f. sp. avenae]
MQGPPPGINMPHISARRQVDKIFDRVGLRLYGEKPTGSQSSANSTPGIQPAIHVEPPTPEQHQQHTKPLPFASQSSAASLGKDSASTAAPSKGLFDPDFINKITALYHTFVQPPHPSVPTPPQPTAWDLTMSLHKWLTPVPKLLVDSSNFQTWKCMLQQALQSVFAHRFNISDTNLILSADKEIVLQLAILSTVADNIKIAVADTTSGLDGFRLIEDGFTLRTRTAHVALAKEILNLKFNHLDRSASLDTHVCKLDNLLNQLCRSGFTLDCDLILGLLLHLSLPNLKGFPFVNVSRQLDLQMRQGNFKVTTQDVLQLAKNKLTLFRQNKRGPASKRPDQSNSQPPSDSSNTACKWCSKCRNNSHATSECTKANSTQHPSGNFCPTAPASSTPYWGGSAPPRTTFQAQSAKIKNTPAPTVQEDVPTLQSVLLHTNNPDVIQENWDFINKHAGRLFGLDLCTSHTFTNDLTHLFDQQELSPPPPPFP